MSILSITETIKTLSGMRDNSWKKYWWLLSRASTLFSPYFYLLKSEVVSLWNLEINANLDLYFKSNLFRVIESMKRTILRHKTVGQWLCGDPL